MQPFTTSARRQTWRHGVNLAHRVHSCCCALQTPLLLILQLQLSCCQSCCCLLCHHSQQTAVAAGATQAQSQRSAQHQQTHRHMHLKSHVCVRNAHESTTKLATKEPLHTTPCTTPCQPTHTPSLMVSCLDVSTSAAPQCQHTVLFPSPASPSPSFSHGASSASSTGDSFNPPLQHRLPLFAASMSARPLMLQNPLLG